MSKIEEMKCQKNWAATIESCGGLSINTAFPADAEMLPLVDVALAHLARQYPGVKFDVLGTPRDVLRELRGTEKFNRVRIARIAPRQHWVSYAVKVIRNSIQDLYFRDAERLNPFNMPGTYLGQAPGEVLQYRDFAKKLRSISTSNIFRAPDDSEDILQGLENQELDAHLRLRCPIIWAMRQGLSLPEIRGFLGEARRRTVSSAQLSQDLLAEVCVFAEVSGRPLEDVQRELEPLLQTLRGARGSYGHSEAPNSEVFEEVGEVLRASA